MPIDFKKLGLAIGALALTTAFNVRAQEDAPPPVAYYSEPVPEPVVVFDANAIWYHGPHTIPGGGWCAIWGAHTHDYAPAWGDRYSFINGYYYYQGEPGADAPSYVYFGHHPNPWGGWCYVNFEHRHYYPPRQTDNYRWEGSHYVFGGVYDQEYTIHRNEYDEYGHRRVGNSYNEHVQYVQAHPPPPGIPPGELMRMQREREQQQRIAAQQREQTLRNEQIRINQQRGQQMNEQQRLNQQHNQQMNEQQRLNEQRAQERNEQREINEHRGAGQPAPQGQPPPQGQPHPGQPHPGQPPAQPPPSAPPPSHAQPTAQPHPAPAPPPPAAKPPPPAAKPPAGRRPPSGEKPPHQ